ncbi:unnamed protein product [Amoebophrya sp. A25]|nr:unnamed protein product [Amoebophrya sp. A25]|eukprot:GSA25T00016846001.1
MTGDPSSSRHPSRSRECASRSRECGGQPETPGTTEGRRKTRTKEKPIKQASRLGLERQGSKSYSKSYKSKIPQQSRGTQLLREALRRQKKRRVQKATSWTEDAWIQEQLGRKKKSTTRKKDAVAVDVDVNTSTESGIVERDEIEKHVTPGEKECSTLAAVAEEKHTGAAKKVYQSNGNVEQQLAKNIDAREQKEHAEEAYPYDQQQSHNLHQNEIEKIQHKNLQQEDHVSSSNKKEEKSTTTTTKSCKPSLEWRNLTFQVGSGANQDPKTILDRCYGRLHPGELCALIGPSGAGKSTLMNLLAGRQDWGCYDPCDNHVDAYHAEQNDDEPDVDNNVQVVDKGAPSSPTRTHHLVSSSAALRQGTSRPLTSSATATNIKNNTKVYKTSTSSKGTCTMYKTSSKGTMGKNVRQEGVDGYSSSASSAATTTASESESSRASSNLTSCVGSEGLSDVFASSSCTELTTDNEESQEDAYSSVSEIEMEDNAEGTTIRRGRKQDYKNRAGVFKRKTKRCNIDETTCTGATGNSTTTRGTAPASSANISNQSTTNALAQRASTLAPGALRLTGSVRYGSQLLTQETLKQSVSYVMQEDALHPRQTVYEVLLFAARMRLVGQSEERMRERVASLMQLVGLEGCRDVLVGDHLIKGISGGQKKRLSVAIELLTSPEILFLDEPTSGLDSFYSLALIRSLREICRAEQNIMCCTIHQPSAELFSMFDRVYCLRTGRVLLCGALQAGSVIRDLRAFGRLILKNSRGRKGLEAREQEEIEEDADDDADENDAGTDDQDSSPESESEQEKHALLERGSRIIQKTTSKRKSTSGSEKMGSPRTSPRTTTMLTTMKKERKSSVGRSLPSAPSRICCSMFVSPCGSETIWQIGCCTWRRRYQRSNWNKRLN